MPLDQVLDDVSAALDRADSVNDACVRTVHVVARHTPAIIAALLHVQDHLRCVATTGSWQVYSSVADGVGVVGRVFATGHTVTLTEVERDADYISLGPKVAVEICAPLPRADGTPAGAFNVEWTTPVDIEQWRPVIEEIGRRLGARIHDLGGPLAESNSERLLRHALAVGTAENPRDLSLRVLTAAREVSGLATAAVLMRQADGVTVCLDHTQPDRLGDRLARVDPARLATLTAGVDRHGAAYTLGDPSGYNAEGFETLTSIGVRTMITVPIGPPLPAPAAAVLLLADERATHPEPATVNLLQLLATHAWTSLDRLRNLTALRAKASSDPLTGLQHHGPFGERLTRSVPGRTALLAIDVDQFKKLNDTYGHQAGDQALIELAQILQHSLRTGDELYRIGGDEFAAVIEVHSTEEALAIGDRMVNAARRIDQPISVGVAIQSHGETAEHTLHRADLALYEAKRRGRDGVRLAGPRRIADVA